jgi:putative aldouronate transport system substrate-binding protein
MSKKLLRVVIVGVLLFTATAPWVIAAKGFNYPMNISVTLKYWMDLHPNLAAVYKNFGDSPLAKELEKRTGVKCEYQHPVSGQEREKLNLMIAAGDLPDVIEYIWAQFPGGPNGAINNGAILRLNNVYDKYSPNLKRYLKAHPEWDRMTKTDEGDYYVFPSIRAGQSLLVTSGPVVRKDWLDDLNLGLPETIDDWYLMLKAFKEKKGATVPLTTNLTYLRTDFGPAFDVCGDQLGFYLEKNKVKYSFDTPGYREFLRTMNQWYSEGLLDPNFALFTTKSRDAYILSGKSGASDCPAASGIGAWMDVMSKKDPKFNISGTRYCSPKKGQLPRFVRSSQVYGGGNKGNAAISAKAKPEAVEAAARLLDYNFSPAGIRLMNFGIEGVSYTLVNGKPKYTEAVMNDPKLAPANSLARYIRANSYGPFPSIPEYLEEYYLRPQLKEAQKYWMQNNTPNTSCRRLPPMIRKAGSWRESSMRSTPMSKR